VLDDHLDRAGGTSRCMSDTCQRAVISRIWAWRSRSRIRARKGVARGQRIGLQGTRYQQAIPKARNTLSILAGAGRDPDLRCSVFACARDGARTSANRDPAGKFGPCAASSE
jgi:hypothetical protein